MGSRGALRWGPSKGNQNVNPYMGFAAYPVTCIGCSNLFVFGQAIPVRTKSSTQWPQGAALQKLAQSKLLVVTVVIGQCDKEYQEPLFDSVRSLDLTLAVLHDQPDCR